MWKMVQSGQLSRPTEKAPRRGFFVSLLAKTFLGLNSGFEAPFLRIVMYQALIIAPVGSERA
jgi:hypothetical protein